MRRSSIRPSSRETNHGHPAEPKSVMLRRESPAGPLGPHVTNRREGFRGARFTLGVGGLSIDALEVSFWLENCLNDGEAFNPAATSVRVQVRDKTHPHNVLWQSDLIDLTPLTERDFDFPFPTYGAWFSEVLLPSP